MIVVKTPLRISFVGGGSDIPCFYQRHPGSVVNAAIGLHTYVAIKKAYGPHHTIKYSKTELVPLDGQIEHPIIRHCLQKWPVTEPLDIGLFSDVPGRGSGLGSSSSFTVGLIHALYRLYGGISPDPHRLATEACQIEIEKIGEPIGKQDQFAAAYGGLNYFTFETDGSVTRKPISIHKIPRSKLEERLFLVSTGVDRRSGDLLTVQNEGVKSSEDTFNYLVSYAKYSEDFHNTLRIAIAHNDHDLHLLFKGAISESWQTKYLLNPSAITDEMETLIKQCASFGANAWKGMGAGGGGFMLFWVPDKRRDEFVRSTAKNSIKALPVTFDDKGSTAFSI